MLLTSLAICALTQATEPHEYIDPKKLPKYGYQSSKIIKPIVVSRPAGSTLQLPPGFRASVWAKGLKSPRWMLALPNGDVIVTESYQKRLALLHQDSSGDVRNPPRHKGEGAGGEGLPTSKHIENTTLVTGLDLPHGLVYRDGYLYVANTGSIVRYKYELGDKKITSPREVILSNIPQRGYNMHWTRDICFSPDGKWLYLAVGSESNRAVEQPPRACIMRMRPDGTDQTVFTSGLRNPVGITFRPGTQELWTTCVERDYMGDDLVPDFITQVKEGQFYGWPWYFIGKNRDPRTPNPPKTPVTVPDVLVTAHSVPLQMLFCTGRMFPEKYRGDMFVAMRGSTNRRRMAGYRVVRIDYEHGVRKPGYYGFAEGWVPNRNDPHVYGRPVGLCQLTDGSMLVSDEGAGMIWRITYGP